MVGWLGVGEDEGFEFGGEGCYISHLSAIKEIFRRKEGLRVDVEGRWDKKGIGRLR